ncbi:unnamed protein product [Pleuronectes platessa]|uniref:EGF-like domain-containing protein n=1 Tax=Pleuronectes platessa TaxID=8262 RepID=A0A9N7Z001_PLEPL|nr:unnamed protein product [Pleuronectes platessa]
MFYGGSITFTELLSACHELRCRYGCVMTRNGTFCFCADGFEVGEDGTSCRGRILLRRWWEASCHEAPPTHPTHTPIFPHALGPVFLQMNKREVLGLVSDSERGRQDFAVEDHDECAVYGACSQTCTNTYGSYRCSCTEGYILQPDMISCKAKQDPGDSRPALLIGGSDRIVITHLNGTGLKPLRSLSANGTLALDFQHKQESVCWVLSTESSGQLRCAETRNLRGFTREQQIKTQQSLQHVEQMAIDWLTGNFYFVDRANDNIFVCDRGGTRVLPSCN